MNDAPEPAAEPASTPDDPPRPSMPEDAVARKAVRSGRRPLWIGLGAIGAAALLTVALFAWVMPYLALRSFRNDLEARLPKLQAAGEAFEICALGEKVPPGEWGKHLVAQWLASPEPPIAGLNTACLPAWREARERALEGLEPAPDGSDTLVQAIAALGNLRPVGLAGVDAAEACRIVGDVHAALFDLAAALDRPGPGPREADCTGLAAARGFETPGLAVRPAPENLRSWRVWERRATAEGERLLLLPSIEETQSTAVDIDGLRGRAAMARTDADGGWEVLALPIPADQPYGDWRCDWNGAVAACLVPAEFTLGFNRPMATRAELKPLPPELWPPERLPPEPPQGVVATEAPPPPATEPPAPAGEPGPLGIGPNDAVGEDLLWHQRSGWVRVANFPPGTSSPIAVRVDPDGAVRVAAVPQFERAGRPRYDGLVVVRWATPTAAPERVAQVDTPEGGRSREEVLLTVGPSVAVWTIDDGQADRGTYELRSLGADPRPPQRFSVEREGDYQDVWAPVACETPEGAWLLLGGQLLLRAEPGGEWREHTRLAPGATVDDPRLSCVGGTLVMAGEHREAPQPASARWAVWATVCTADAPCPPPVRVSKHPLGRYAVAIGARGVRLLAEYQPGSFDLAAARCPFDGGLLEWRDGGWVPIAPCGSACLYPDAAAFTLDGEPLRRL